MGKAIEILGLSKSFRDVRAVDGVSFSVMEGEMLAFLGTIGAGKSTTINMITGELCPDEGRVLILGEDVRSGSGEVKGKIGVVFQSSVLDASLTVLDNLKSRAALYGIFGDELRARIEELSALLDLDGLLGRTVGRLSGGERRRIDIARALIHKPKILILDEPTTGLDPKTRNTIWQIVDGLKRNEGLTVLVTTHYMEEAAGADLVVVIEKGRIIATGTPLELKNKYASDYVTVFGVSEEEIKAVGYPYTPVKDGYKLVVSTTREAAELIRKYPEIFIDFEITKGKMDDVFLSLTGRREGGEI